MSDQSSTRRTPVVGGALVLACAVAWAVRDLDVGIASGNAAVDVGIAYAVAALLLAGMIVLARGTRSETGAFGASRLVVSGAIIFGARNAAFALQGGATTRLAISTLLAQSGPLTALSLLLTAVFTAAIIVVAVAQTRRGRASRFELTALWAVAGAQVLVSLMSFVGTVPVALFLARAHAELVLPLCLALLGLAYLTDTASAAAIPRSRSATSTH